MAAENIVGAIPDRHGAATSTTPTTRTGIPTNADQPSTTSRAAIPAGDPSSARTMDRTWSPRATSTGMTAWSTTADETDPSSAASTGPCPRLPTTVRSGFQSLASSGIANAGAPRSRSVSTASPADARRARDTSMTRVRSRRACASYSSAPAGMAGIHGPPQSAGAMSRAATTRTTEPGGHGRLATSSRARDADGEPSTARRMRMDDRLRCGVPPSWSAPGGTARRNRPKSPARWADSGGSRGAQSPVSAGSPGAAGSPGTSSPDRAISRRGPAGSLVSSESPTRPARSRPRSRMSRPPQPEDLYRFRIPTDPQLPPDGDSIAFTVQVAAPGRDTYRHAIWLVPADASAPAG